jgi:hypothetical protein
MLYKNCAKFNLKSSYVLQNITKLLLVMYLFLHELEKNIFNMMFKILLEYLNHLKEASPLKLLRN